MLRCIWSRQCNFSSWTHRCPWKPS